MRIALHPLLPGWWLALTVVPLLALALCQAVLAGRSTPRASRAAWTRRAAIVALVGLMGLGPAVAINRTDTRSATVDVFFVVDLTGSMAAEDYDGTAQRLVGVRHDIVDLTHRIPGARFSVIAFDSQASRELPLTQDTRAVAAWATTADREITPYSNGSRIDRPLDELAEGLADSHARHPANTRLVFFLSDGESTRPGTSRSYAALAPLVDGGAVLGYGTSAGGRMRAHDPHDPTTPYIPAESTTSREGRDGDSAARDAVSVIDETALRALADQLGVPYLHRTGPTQTTDLVAGVDPARNAADGRRDVTTYRVIIWPLALPVAGLLGLEAWTWAAGAIPGPRRRQTGTVHDPPTATERRS